MSSSFHRYFSALFLGITWLSFGVSSAASIEGGLVAAYGFNEGSGTGLTDLSGHGNSGVIHDATWTSGRFGSALMFDGDSSFVSVDDSTWLELSNAMTLEAWAYANPSQGGWMDLIYKGNDAYFLQGSSDQGGMPAVGGTFASSPLFGQSALPQRAWSHMASTYDGSTLKLYVNGVEVASRAQSGPLRFSAQPLYIGGDTEYGDHWAGKVDEVRIYNRALTPAEIQADMANAVVAATDTTPPLVSIVAPAADPVASHVVLISAAASDDTALASVEFFADGLRLQGVVAPPYQASWNTTTSSNGLHVLTAVATDLAGNRATSAPVVVRTLNPAFVNEVVVPGIVSATTIAFLPDARMLVGELTETVWVVQRGNSQQDPTPFLQFDNTQLFGEQGLMDIVLDPHFADNNYIYIFYTRGFPGQHNRDRVSRFTVSGNTALPASEFVVWQDDVDAPEEHHGGALAFGPEEKLFITVGEHFHAPEAAELDSYHGKLLRVNSDGTIPTDNPFYDGNGPNKDEIWAYGLRNPFRMSYDAPTGRLFIGDVGGNDFSTAWEEVNLVARGANYGWPYCEGYCSDDGVTSPFFSYFHFGRDACVAGGIVYRGSQFPSEYYGSYFFGDYVQNWIKRITFGTDGSLAAVLDFEPADGSTDGPMGDPVKLIEGPDGSLYYVDLGFNDAHVPNPAAIRRIRYTISNLPPQALATATPINGLPALDVSFSSAGSSDPEGATLSYAWSFGDGSTSTLPNPTHTYQSAGLYTARLSVSDGTNNSISSNLTITVGNSPTAKITSPLNGRTFRAGNIITFTGTGNDLEDGSLSASQFSWSIAFHHAGHIHPGGGPFTNITSGTFTIPTTGHDFSGETSYEIILSVTDSNGLRGSDSVTIFPEKVNMAFDTIPSGLALDLGGIRKTTPFVQDAVIGFQYTLNTPQQMFGGSNFQFLSWSDGGPSPRVIVIPETNASLVATFQLIGPAGPVAAYGFEEASGKFVKDLSGNGNDGILEGPARAAGRFGAGLTFNGVDNWVTVTNSASLQLSNAMTLEAWVKPASVTGDWRDIIYKGEDVYYLEATTTSGGTPGTGGTFAVDPLFADNQLQTGVWTHLASTYDGTSLRLFVDGVEVANRAQGGTIESSSNPLRLGGDEFFGQFFEGMIDEVRIYNRALAQNEIQTDMNLPVFMSVPKPKLAISPLAGTSFRLHLTGVPGIAYRVEFSDRLDPPLWQGVGTFIPDTLGVVDVTNAPPAGSTQGFFRSAYP
jgi:glucose/arabinose dehydrogenase/PKD repeat protein